MVVSARWFGSRGHVRPSVGGEVVGPCVIEKPGSRIPSAEQDHAVGLRIVRHGVVRSDGRTRGWGHVCPLIRPKVVRPSVVEWAYRAGSAEQDYEVDSGII